MNVKAVCMYRPFHIFYNSSQGSVEKNLPPCSGVSIKIEVASRFEKGNRLYQK